MKQPALNLVVVRSHDIDRLADFYRIIGLDLVRHRHGSGPEHYAYEHDGVVFEIYPRQSDADSTAGVRIGFQIASIDALVSELASTGVPIISAARDSPWGRRAVVEDPDGHRVELIDPTTQC